MRQTQPALSDWAGSSFCTAEYDSPYTGNSYDGVAACGTAYGDGGNSNEQGPISYDGVQFDSVGFQCVELVMRYMYYDDPATLSWATVYWLATGDESVPRL